MAKPRILVPIDFSPSSCAAVRYAASLNAHMGGRLELVHALGCAHIRVGGGKPVGLLADIADDATRAAAAEFFEQVALAGIGPSTVMAIAASPMDAIESTLQTTDWDLVVMGRSSKGALRRRLFGSIVDRVMRAARCPVVTVAADREREPARGASQNRLRGRVTVP